MRRLEPRDVPRVLELAAEQNGRDRTSYPVPQLFGPDGQLVDNMPLALVTECDGAVQQAVLFERTTEVMCFGTNPRATSFSRREMDRMAYLLKLRGYTGAHCFVPVQAVEHMEKPLGRAGYERVDHKLAHFFRDFTR